MVSVARETLQATSLRRSDIFVGAYGAIDRMVADPAAVLGLCGRGGWPGAVRARIRAIAAQAPHHGHPAMQRALGCAGPGGDLRESRRSLHAGCPVEPFGLP